MSEGKATSQFKKRRSRKRKNEAIVYVSMPIIFVLISMTVAVPILCGLMNYAVNYVHTAQKTLCMDYYDIKTDNSFDAANSSSYADSIHIGKLMGNIKCDRVGLNERVYYGINRVSMRNGAGMDNTSYLPGNEGCVYIAGYASSAFGTLYNIKKGDSLTLETYWGKFNYKVVDAGVGKDVNEMKPKGDSVILATSSSTDAFAVNNNEKYYVAAVLTSKEVQ